MKKQIINKIIKHPTFTKFFLLNALRIHSFSYKVASKLSAALEPDGLHPKHRLLRYHDWFISRLKKNWDVLDIGCGNGALAYDMKSACRSIVGVDINKMNIEEARKNYFKEGITYICCNALKYKYETGFHAIVMSNFLEHIDERVNFLKSLYKDQGEKNSTPILLLRVPMITRDWISMYKKEIGVEWRLDNTHYTEYDLEQLFDEMNQAGLVIESYDVQFGEFYGVVIRR